MALVSMVYMQNLRSGSFTLTHRVYQCIQSVFVKDVKPRSESLTSRQIKISKYQKVVLDVMILITNSNLNIARAFPSSREKNPPRM